MTRLVSIAIAAAVPLAAAPRIHTLPLQPANVHWGYFDANVPPVLHIASGDRVVVETMVARGIERLKQAGANDREIPASCRSENKQKRAAGFPDMLPRPIPENEAGHASSATVVC